MKQFLWDGDPTTEPDNDSDERDSAETNAEMRNDDKRMNKKQENGKTNYNSERTKSTEEPI